MRGVALTGGMPVDHPHRPVPVVNELCRIRRTPHANPCSRCVGVFAEFERSIIRERVNAGLARVRANGKRLGRPTVSGEVEDAIRLALTKGDKWIRKIARD